MEDMLKKRLLVIVALLLIIMCGSGYAYYQRNLAPESVSSDAVLPHQAYNSKTDALTVYISGAVMHPGVIKVPAGTRIIDVIDLAGGLSPGADVNKLNLAQPVKDGMHVKVAGTIEHSRADARSGNEKLTGEKVNINTADKNELDTLPGVGPTLAQRIIDYRQAHGAFKDISELRKVSGITESRFNKLKDKITI